MGEVSVRHSPGSLVQLLVSVPSRQVAEKISLRLLEVNLCACAQIVGPVSSSFRWQTQIETVEEYLLLLKSRKQNLDSVEQTVCDLHPYEVPEILVFEIAAGHSPYLDWLEMQTNAPR